MTESSGTGRSEAGVQAMSVDRETIRYERGDDGVVVLVMDDPAQPANTMNAAYVASMTSVLDRLEDERGDISGVIVTSAKPTWFAGGDLNDLVTAGPQDAERLTALLAHTKRDLRRLETLGRPVVAAIEGSALGGGLEIALACHHRIVLDSPRTSLGLPEVTLGLLPGAGGVTRTVRMLGLVEALTRVLLEGRSYSPQRALELGLIDEVVTDRDQLMAAGRAWIAAHPDAAQPWDHKGFKIPGGSPSTPALAATLQALPANLVRHIKGAPMPAPRRIMAAAVEGAQVDVETAQLIETRYLVELLTGQIAKNMIGAFFFDTRQIASGAARPAGFEPWRPQRAAVLGAGMMGAGIAYQLAKAGVPVVLKDVDDAAAARGRAHAEGILGSAVRRGRQSQAQADAVLARITTTADPATLAGCDLLIEAVFEDTALKHRVLAEAAAVLAPGALIASNTSTLPITLLAQGVPVPEQFIGLHFFSPVHRMPLLEVVVGERTDDATLARALDVAALMGKTPIVVNDSRGFFTSRVIGRFMDEAVGMLAEGVHPASIEQAALQAGYPTGPLALVDEVSLSLAQRIRGEYTAAARAAGQERPAHPAHAVIDRMVALGRTGRASGRGFYDYGEDGRRLGLWPGLVGEFGAEPAPRTADQALAGMSMRDVQERMLFAEALDAVRCLDEHVLRSAAEGNVGSIIGIGFPPWTGGVLRYVEAYPGSVAGFVARAEQLAGRYGDRFTPPESLRTRVGAVA
ncbi:MAG TPA: 3-hydroxyacyl-CoA dehydrogenase NAD-binding domain-containing protein [Kineosporiaceae bacterium]|nr:3-hydroxyacyl-CoA dehydrogenase NAD-binding domain-containing protein [Kineosporiaceae bacterium]